MTICRELTKLHEEIFHGTLSEAVSHFSAPRGEFTLVVEGRPAAKAPTPGPEIEKRLSRLSRSGRRAKEAVAEVARETGFSRKELYRTWLKAKIKTPGAN